MEKVNHGHLRNAIQGHSQESREPKCLEVILSKPLKTKKKDAHIGGKRIRKKGISRGPPIKKKSRGLPEKKTSYCTSRNRETAEGFLRHCRGKVEGRKANWRRRAVVKTFQFGGSQFGMGRRKIHYGRGRKSVRVKLRKPKS